MNYPEGAIDLSEYAQFSPTLETETTSAVDIEWFGDASQSDYVVAFIPGILDPSNEMAQSFYENLDDKLKIASMGLKYNEKQAFNLANITAQITQEVTQHNKPIVLVGYSFGAFLALEVAQELQNPPLGALFIGPCMDDESIKHGFIRKLKEHPTTMERLLITAVKTRGIFKKTSVDEEQYALNQVKAIPNSAELPYINYPIITAFTESDRFINKEHVNEVLRRITKQYHSIEIPSMFVSNGITGILGGHHLDPAKYSQLNQQLLIPEIESLIHKSVF